MSPLAVVDLVVAAWSVTTAWLASRTATRAPRSSRAAAGISIIRPCEGAEPGLDSALRAPERPGEVEVLACTTTRSDPAASIARETGATLVFDRPETAAWTNPKARHLDAGLAAARFPFIVFADADARFTGEDVDALVEGLAEEGVTGIFAPPMAEDRPRWGNRILRTALGGSLYAWPALVSLTRALGQPIPMSGALVAFEKCNLPEGLEAAAHSIGDDLAIASALQTRGRLEMAPKPVMCLHGDISLADAVRTLRRWVFVAIRHSPLRFFGFPFLFCSTPLLVALALADVRSLGALALALAMASRFVAVARIRRRLLDERARVMELLLVEVVLFDAALRALFALVTKRELAWRHRRYTLGPRGRIESVRSV